MRAEPLLCSPKILIRSRGSVTPFAAGVSAPAEMAAGKDDLLGARGADVRGEPLFRSARSRLAEVHFRHPEFRALDRDTQVASEREEPSATNREAVDRRDGRQLEILQQGHRAPD